MRNCSNWRNTGVEEDWEVLQRQGQGPGLAGSSSAAEQEPIHLLQGGHSWTGRVSLGRKALERLTWGSLSTTQKVVKGFSVSFQLTTPLSPSCSSWGEPPCEHSGIPMTITPCLVSVRLQSLCWVQGCKDLLDALGVLWIPAPWRPLDGDCNSRPSTQCCSQAPRQSLVPLLTTPLFPGICSSPSMAHVGFHVAAASG